MASRNNDISDNKEPVKPRMNHVQFFGPFRLVIRAEETPSGNGYIFPGPGAIVEVDERDVERILKTRSGMAPCPGCSESMLFEILD